MPSQDIPNPSATGAVDRLTLTTSSARGSVETGGWPPCTGCVCNCFDAEASGYSNPMWNGTPFEAEASGTFGNPGSMWSCFSAE